FDGWYQGLGSHSLYEYRMEYTQSLEEWVKSQPLSILQLDPADRAVLKIAGILFINQTLAQGKKQ
ncbi:hypothetical protein B4U79_04783, partial [Dinothrombium tinctorium]